MALALLSFTARAWTRLSDGQNLPRRTYSAQGDGSDAMAIPQGDLRTPVAPQPSTSHLLPYTRRSATTMQAEHVITYNAEASSSRTLVDADHVTSKRTSSKKLERRVLPARIASSIANSASNSTSVSRELDDMVMECFVKAFLETRRASDSSAVIITTEPMSTLRDDLQDHPGPEPSFWDGPFSGFRRATEIKQKRVSQAAQRSVEPGNTPQSHQIQRGIDGHHSIFDMPPAGAPSTSNSSRGLRARALVKYTDSAVLKPEPMDTSNEFFVSLNGKHEMTERKDKIRETDKIIHARNKLKTRIEMLEMVDEHVWLGHVEKLLKKAARYAENEKARGMDTSKETSERGQRNMRKGRMTEDELAENVQRLVLLTGFELVKRKSAEQLKEDLIDDGKELLHKYNKTLGIRSRKHQHKDAQGVRSVQSDEEDESKLLSTEVDIHESGPKRSKRKPQDVPPSSSSDSLSPSPEPEPLPRDAAAQSDDESVYSEIQPAKPKKKQSKRRPISRRVGRPPPANRAAVLAGPVLPEEEPIYAPVTASGLPVIIEAANKRLSIMRAEAERKRLDEEAKSKRKKIPEMRNKISRASTAPFGMRMPLEVGKIEMFDLDGPFWLPFFKARLEGGFTLESVKAQDGFHDMQASIVPPEYTAPVPQTLPTDSAGAASAGRNDSAASVQAVTVPDPDTMLTEVERVEVIAAAEPDNQTTSFPCPPPIPESLVSFAESHLLTQQGPEIPEIVTTSSQAIPAPCSRLPTPISHDTFVYRRQELNDAQDNTDHASDIVPDSQPGDLDVVPSSWRTEDAVPSSGG